MKSLVSVIATFMDHRSSRSNLKALLRLGIVLAAMILTFSTIFHFLMEREGQHFTWITGVYWTLTVMTTLGFGDITFHGDAGRLFSIIVLMTGLIFLLVILPFTFIEFFYAPWMRAQAAARTPRELPEKTRGHVILTNWDPITKSLAPLLMKYGHPFFILCPNSPEALELDEQGLPATVGDLDDPETYQLMRLKQAAMLVTTRSDVLNTNITFTAREVAEHIPIIATADTEASCGVLELAGATQVLRVDQTMARALARRVIGRDRAAHLIGETKGLQIAEANAAGTELEGKTIAESDIRQRSGVSVIGFWDHGHLRAATPDTPITRHSLLVLAGTSGQFERYNAAFSRRQHDKAHVLIIGGGRVGRLISAELRAAGISTCIIEKIAERVSHHPEAVIGDATHMDILKAARAREADTVIITTHDDDLNIALTVYFRRLRESYQIISRCTGEHNVRTLHRAGADLVLSSASMGANTIFNSIRSSDNLLLAEGVFIFPSPVPKCLAGAAIKDSAVRSETGCTIIAVEHEGGRIVNPEPETILPEGGILILIGTLDAEEKYLKTYEPELAPEALRKKWGKRRKA